VTRRRRRRINLTLNALAIVLGGLAVGWLLSRVTTLANDANVAAVGEPVTWLRALTALAIVTIAVIAVIACHRTPDDYRRKPARQASHVRTIHPCPDQLEDPEDTA
jgi:hypothetical protein